MKKKNFIYFIIIAVFLLLIWNISALDFDNLNKGPYLGIGSNILIIIAMMFSLRSLPKNEK